MRLYLFSILMVFVTASCQSDSGDQNVSSSPVFEKAIAVIHPIGEQEVNGTVEFEATEEGVSVTAVLSGLSEGNHGFHIHQFGDCTAPDGTSAGGHFNPAGNEHSSPESANRHMGDMGNIIANASGEASLYYVDGTITMDQIIGRGIIVHAGEDDLTSQPSGAAGARIGCGVIGISGN